jgi:hypothetical protein
MALIKASFSECLPGRRKKTRAKEHGRIIERTSEGAMLEDQEYKEIQKEGMKA